MGQTEHLEEPLEFAKYQLIAHLAEGRMGDVYKAKSHGVEGFEKILCVKIIDTELADTPGFVDTLIEEAKRAVSLSHANVAQVYDLGRDEESGKFYLANEYVNGFDLGRALSVAQQTGREWPRDLSIYIVSEAAKGIDYAHRRKDFNFNNLNLLHRDVHPSNIIVSFEGEVKLTDFGVSRAMERVDADAEPSAERRYLYAPPEHVREQTYTRKSDIFSLGLVLYEMLTGNHPYRDTPRPIRDAARAADIPPLGDVIDAPQKLQQIVDSMLVPDPAGRASSAGSVYEELVGFLFGNNLRADNRALSLLFEELRQAESGGAASEPDDAGTDKISRAEVENFYDKSSESLQPPIDRIRRIQDAQEEAEDEQTVDVDEEMLADGPSEPLPDLPGGLETCFDSAREGAGRAVLMSGHFGRGPQYLPDRISEVLAWRGNARALAVHATPDDVYRPFGVLSDAIVRFLTDESPDDVETRRHALDRLSEITGDAEGLDLLRGLWVSGTIPQSSGEQRRDQLAELFVTMLRELSREQPVVLVVDRVERADDVTIDVLRRVVGAIDELSAMIVLATSADEMMRATFDVGRPDSLRAIRVSAPEAPDLDGIPDLPDDASEVLLSLALSEQPLTYEALAEILDYSIDRIAGAAEELTDADLVRTPDSETLLTGVSEASVWVKLRFDSRAIRRNARDLCRYYRRRTSEDAAEFRGPTRIRMHAAAQERRQTLNLADRYSDWLERTGWLDIALDFYHYCSDLLAQEPIGSPQSRIRFLLARAELALDLSQLDQARNSLEPLRALSETMRNEQGFVRSQLLFGRMALQQDDLDKAHDCLKRANEVARAIREPQLLAVSLLELARWADRFGDVAQAQQYLQGAINLSSRWGTYRMDLRERARMLQQAVRIYTQRGMHRRAVSAARDLEMLADSSGLGELECRSALAEAHLDADEDRPEEALERLDAAFEVAQRVGRTALTFDLLRRRTALALEAGLDERVMSLADELVEQSARHDDLYSEQRGRALRAVASARLDRERGAAIDHLRASLERAKQRRVPRDIYRCHKYLARAFEPFDATRAAEHRETTRSWAERIRYTSTAA